MQSKFSPTTPHFFKIIFEHTLRNNKLQIPNKVVKIYGDTLSDSICVKLPCGLTWDLGLTKCDGKKRYRDGLSSKPNRVEKHGIDRQPDELVKEETEEDDDSVEILESFSPTPKTREKSLLPSPQPHKRMRTNPVDKAQSKQSHPGPKAGGGEKYIPPKWRKCADVRRHELIAKEKDQAFKRASGFKSKDPFCMIVMPPSYVRAKYALNLPYQFATKHLGIKNAYVILNVGNGRDNDLKVGDVCVFVLTKSSGISFDVAIFRKNKIGNTPVLPVHKAATAEVRPSGRNTVIDKKTGMSAPSRHPTQVNVKGKARALEKESHSHSENPSFTVVMPASYATAKCFFANSRSWSVQYKVRRGLDGRQAAEFRHGWTSLAHDNSLREGDICTFEPTHGNKMSFKVSIVKARDHLPQGACEKATKPVKPKRKLSSMYSMNASQTEEHEEIIDEPAGKFMKLISEENSGCQVTQTPSTSRANRASKAADSFSSKNPYFQVDFPSGHQETNRLNLPLTFRRSYLGEKSQTVTLQVGERSWPVKLLVYPGLYKFSGGWSAFVRENFLRPRDALFFELIRRNHVVLKVSIRKQAV
ncbi:hypothetical protein TIFTF001_002578 [Ficus carica]|uniref:TF-B3 domain-containing protein n=1 Tax=Ficus carica TaxID=3494 RepID=A0AA87Z5K9_FICCA|nr:hypothetical protein TIFTF001_002578 [Ficus carica]